MAIHSSSAVAVDDVGVRKLLRTLRPEQLLLAFAVIVLNLADAFCTLRNVSFGAQELNPLMTVLLETSSVSFVLFKHSMVALGVVLILINWQNLLARIGLLLSFTAFVMIVIYQCVLLSWGPLWFHV